MLNILTNYFKEPPAKPVTADAESVKKEYKNNRIRVFAACFIGYTMFHLCKKNLGVALPAMSLELGYTNAQLGLLGSSLYFTYAFGKFLNGVLADRADARKFFSAALFLSALANIAFGLSFSVIKPNQFVVFGIPSATILLWVMMFFWGVNGWFQSMGFPAIAKTLTYWFSTPERGTKWAAWSTSHQFGTFLCIGLSGFIIIKFGWQAAFIIPGVINLFVSLYLFNQMRDKPQSIGLPDIEEYHQAQFKTESTSQDVKEDEQSYFSIFKKYILFNPTLWALAFAYVFVYIVRFGTEDWIIKYLVDMKSNTLKMASFKLCFLALFGVVGVLLAGFISDKVFKGQRAPVNIIFLAGVMLCIIGLMLNHPGPNFLDAAFHSLTHKSLVSQFRLNGGDIMDILYVGMIGFFTSGPQMLIGGLCAVESASKKVASAATGFTGIFGYVGAIISGAGTGKIVDKFGWNWALMFWALSALLCLLITLSMCGKKKSVK